jgi:small-conductance mechanosensitive channel
VKDFAAQYLLGHEYMKALHRRFNEEGIEIPFPIRTVIMQSPGKAQDALPTAGTSVTPGLEVGDAGADAGEGN